MKIIESFANEARNADMRKQRMEALLSAWRRHPDWLRTDGARFATASPETSTLTSAEWAVWTELLRFADAVRPRTHGAGLETYAAFASLDVQDLKRKGVVRVTGPRVATQWLRSAHSEAGQLGGYSWSVLVRPAAARLNPDICEQVLRKQFREVTLHGEVFLGSTPLGGCPETAAALLGQALATPTSPAIHRLWMLSRALEIEDAFLDQLPASARKTLADALADDLTGAIEHLDVRTDASLEFFAEGQADAPLDELLREMPLPASRLRSLLEAKRFLEHGHREIGDHYFDNVAAAYATVADLFSLAETIKRLPPGRALFAAIDKICRKRPELIATYVWHPAFPAEGAFALLQLPQGVPHSPGRWLNFSDEWLEVQRLGREQLVLADRSVDWPSVLTLGVHDDMNAIARKHYATMPSPLQTIPYDDDRLWGSAVATPERANTFVALLDAHFHERTKRSDATTVFALRFLSPLRDSGQHVAARQLACAIVDGYVAAFTLDVDLLAIPEVLSAYGPLLEDLRVALHDGGAADERWSKWLHPFDVASYIERALAADIRHIDSREVNPGHDVPHIFRAHTEALVAQASASAVFDESLDVALDLYVADHQAGLPIEAFSWNELAQTTAIRPIFGSEPVFVRVGRLIGRSKRGSERIERFLAERPPAHVLAYVLVGLSEHEPLAKRVQQPLRNSVNRLLSDDTGIALGHALELANVLHQAEMPRDAERFARRVLLISERLRPHERQPYADAAYAILAGALAQQKLWAEILALEPELQGRAQQHFVTNMRALALMETEKFADAENVLADLLKEDPMNRVALVNLTALHVRRGAWKETIRAAEVAKSLIPPSEWDGLLLNEVAARERLGDKFGALAVLESLTAPALNHPNVRAMRERLRTGDTSTRPIAREDVSLGNAAHLAASPNSDLTKQVLPIATEPDDAVDIAIVTALLEEYEAVRDRLTGWHAAPPETRQYKNLYAWVLGSIPKADGSGFHRVVLALAGQSGNLRTFSTTMRTIDRWKPVHVLFSGIAGGLKKDDLRQGDVVLSQTIWFYEHGKVVDGRYQPRHRDSFPAHSGLLNSARAFQSATNVWKDCGRPAPNQHHSPKCIHGMIGSGDKVIDDLAPDFVQAILKTRSELQAIEMEAAGAAFAIGLAHDEGQAVGFMMVRGISDMPKEHAHAIKRAFASLFGRADGASGAGTQQRDGWKLYASGIAAHFIVHWVASSWWPTQPRPRLPDHPV